METLEALKSVMHHEHDDRRHPKSQGFASPLVLGIVTYAGLLSLAIGCVLLGSLMM